MFSVSFARSGQRYLSWLLSLFALLAAALYSQTPTQASMQNKGTRADARRTTPQIVERQPAPIANARVYLSDLQPTYQTNGAGPIERDLSNGGLGVMDGRPLTIGYARYRKGLGVAAYSEVRYQLDGRYAALRAEIGVAEEAGTRGSVIFRVLLDGAKVFESAVLKGGMAPQPLSVNVAGRKELKLVVLDAGDSNEADFAIWGDVRLEVLPGASLSQDALAAATKAQSETAGSALPAHTHAPGTVDEDHVKYDAMLAERAKNYAGFVTPQDRVFAVVQQDLSQLGLWSGVTTWPFAFASVATLPDGRILAWGGNNPRSFNGGTNTYAALWNPANNQITSINNNDHSMFCGIPTMLEDGRVFVNGGDGTRERVSIFDWRTNLWTRSNNMNRGRWYPGSVALPNGKVFTALGEPGDVYPEIWTPGQGWTLLNGANLQGPILNFPGYQNNWLPYLHLAPNGNIFHSGPTQQMNWINPNGSGSVASAGINNNWYPKYAAAVMFDEGKILVTGGQIDGNNQAATNQAQLINLNGATPTRTIVAGMSYARKFHNAVVLPNGEVLVLGGNTSGIEFSDDGTVLAPEIWNPTTQTWRTVADLSVPRNYHSVAVLMPDGRVWSGGGGLCNCAADHPDHQVFTPPYLYTSAGTLATRPTISTAPDLVIAGRQLTVQASANITKFSLIKMSGLTHNLNSDLRFLNVPFTSLASGQYQLTLHNNVNVLTPGYWMLFAVNSAGVPSVAKVMQIVTNGAPRVNALGAQTDFVGEAVNLAITANDPNSDPLTFSATGLPPGLSINPSSGVVTGTPTTAGNYRVTVTASDGNSTGSASFDWAIYSNAPIADTFSNFVDMAEMQLNGNAAQAGTVLRLTPNSAGQNGSAYYKTALPITADTSFSTRVQFRIHSGTGADGLAFVMQGNAATALSTSGGGSGLAYAGITKSLAVEVDTWAAAGDPNNNHLGVLTNGNVTAHLATFTPSFTLSDGVSKTLWLDYDGGANTLRVYLAQGAGATKPATPVITQANLDLFALVGAQAYLGFSAATGGSTNTHDIESWSFQVSRNSLNNPPVLTNPGNLTGAVGQAVNRSLSASDPDGDGLSFSATGLPSGLTLNTATGVITGTPTTANTFNVRVTVNDGRGGTASQSFTWTIQPPPLVVNSITAGPRPVNTSITYTATVSNAVSPRYKWLFGDGTAETAYSTSPSVTKSFTLPGLYVVRLTVTDNRGLEVSTSFTQPIHLPTTANRPAVSMNIVYETRANANGRLWVINQDNDTVSVFDAVTNAKQGEITVGKAPRSLAIAPNGRVWVTNKGAATISIINQSTLAVAQTVNLQYGSQPFGLVFAPTGGVAWVALEAAGKLCRLDAVTGTVTGTVNSGPNVRHLSITGDGSRLYAARFISPRVPGEETATPQVANAGGEVLAINTGTLAIAQTIRLQHSNEPDTENSGRGIPNYLGPAVLSPDGVNAWTPSKQDNLLRGTLRDGRNLTFDSTVRSITSRLNLSTGAEDYAARIDHNNAGIASTGLFDRTGNYVFVALEGSREVAVLDAYGNRELLRVGVGRAPQGLALSPDGQRLFVNNFMERTVSVLNLAQLLTTGEPVVPVLATLNTVATEKLTAQVLNGKRLFYDAKDPRLAKDAYISCASCHSDGGQDGRVWDLTGFGEGLRNTTALQGRAAAHGFSHWSGNFDEIQDFEGQIRNLAGGTGLMTDAQFNTGTRNQPLGDRKMGISADLDALAAYVASLNSFANSPYRNNGTLTADAVAGREIYRTANCAQCHSGTAFTEAANGTLRNIGTLKASSGKRLGGTLTGIDTPTLRDAWATAPYLHDGSAATLADAVRAHSGVTVAGTDLTRLVAYLEQVGNEEVSAPTLNQAPTVSLTAPTNNAAYSALATINLTANAGDTDGTVARVEFYQGATKLGEDTTAPYSFTWTGVAAGSYGLTARAVDNAGAATDSAAVTVTVNAAATFTQVYVSDLTPTFQTNGWGPFERDRSNGESGATDGRLLTLNGAGYLKGLGVHAASELRYALNGQFSNFLADVGLDDEVGNNGSVVFQVWADGVKLYDSGLMTGATASKQVNVSVAGRNELRLIVTTSGDNLNYDHADWANARLVTSAVAATNLAQGKTVTQSSTAYGGVATRAVDGNTNGAWANNSVTHTNSEATPWWQVDLGSARRLEGLRLFNRTDCCGERLANFYVFVSNTDMTGRSLASLAADTTISKIQFTGQAPTQFDLVGGMSGRYVRVQLAGTNFLSLAEVQVWGR